MIISQNVASLYHSNICHLTPPQLLNCSFIPHSSTSSVTVYLELRRSLVEQNIVILVSLPNSSENCFMLVELRIQFVMLLEKKYRSIFAMTMLLFVLWEGDSCDILRIFCFLLANPVQKRLIVDVMGHGSIEYHIS